MLGGGEEGGFLHEERRGLPQQVGGRVGETTAAVVRPGKKFDVVQRLLSILRVSKVYPCYYCIKLLSLRMAVLPEPLF